MKKSKFRIVFDGLDVEAKDRMRKYVMVFCKWSTSTFYKKLNGPTSDVSFAEKRTISILLSMELEYVFGKAERSMENKFSRITFVEARRKYGFMSKPVPC